MNKSEELRKMQAPLKDRYKNNPETALVTLKASGKVGEGIVPVTPNPDATTRWPD